MSPVSFFPKLILFLPFLLAPNQDVVMGQKRIIGGTEAEISEFPFLIEISLHNFNNHPMCGASIISESWALTAAHCFMEIGKELKDGGTFSITNYLVLSGTTYTRDMVDQDAKPPKFHNISEYHQHEEFGAHRADKQDGFDIAVFKVDPPFEFDELTQPAKLPEKDEKLQDKYAEIAGWGCTKIHGSTNPRLLYATVRKIKQERCLEYYDTIMHPDSVVCYGTPRKEENASNICQGDSGGPLIVGDNIVTGLVSMSKASGPAIPGIFSSTAYYRDWIREKTGV